MTKINFMLKTCPYRIYLRIKRSQSATNRLVVPSYRLSSVGSRAFPVAAAKIWNALPDNPVSATSLQTFQRHFKTYLFQRSFS